MVVRLIEEFHAPGRGQLLERGQHVRGRPLELLQGRAGDRKGDAETAFVPLDAFEHHLIGRQVTALATLRMISTFFTSSK
jgi:hypothetical protein